MIHFSASIAQMVTYPSSTNNCFQQPLQIVKKNPQKTTRQLLFFVVFHLERRPLTHDFESRCSRLRLWLQNPEQKKKEKSLHLSFPCCLFLTFSHVNRVAKWSEPPGSPPKLCSLSQTSLSARPSRERRLTSAAFRWGRFPSAPIKLLACLLQLQDHSLPLGGSYHNSFLLSPVSLLSVCPEI